MWFEAKLVTIVSYTKTKIWIDVVVEAGLGISFDEHLSSVADLLDLELMLQAKLQLRIE